MKLVPILSDEQTILGHVPLRASKNPILGVVKCECGAPQTVHNPKGKRENRWYTICDHCGTNQSSGDTRQEKLRSEIVDYIEQLGFTPGELTGQDKDTTESATLSAETLPSEKPDIKDSEIVAAESASNTILPGVEDDDHITDDIGQIIVKPKPFFVVAAAVLFGAIAGAVL